MWFAAPDEESPGCGPPEIYHGVMSSKWLKPGVAGVLIVAAGVLGMLLAFLMRQGLAKASLWATFLVLPLTVVIAIAGVWAAVLAARGLHADRVPAGGKAAAGPDIARSGSVYQTGTQGLAIAHTGRGDINLTGLGDISTEERETTEQPDESS